MIPNFKAYIKPLNQIHPIATIFFTGGRGCSIINPDMGIAKGGIEQLYFTESELTFLRPTKNFDDNKIEIYEGDILQIKDEEGEILADLTVHDSNGDLVVECHDFEEFWVQTISCALDYFKAGNWTCHIIGNCNIKGGTSNG